MLHMQPELQNFKSYGSRKLFLEKSVYKV